MTAFLVTTQTVCSLLAILHVTAGDIWCMRDSVSRNMSVAKLPLAKEVVYLKRKILYGVSGGVSLSVVGYVFGLITGITIGGNYFPDLNSWACVATRLRAS